MALNVHAIPGLSKAYYIPNFLSEEEEAYLIRKACQTIIHVSFAWSL